MTDREHLNAATNAANNVAKRLLALMYGSGPRVPYVRERPARNPAGLNRSVWWSHAKTYREAREQALNKGLNVQHREVR